MDQVSEVKGKVEIVDVVRERLELKKAGRNYKGLCPFHGEKTPSFMVNPELQIYKCFGCGESGDVLSFLMKYEGMEFPEALAEMAERVGVTLRRTQGSQGKNEKQDVVRLNELAAKLYQYLLMKHKMGKEGLEYLVGERGLSRATIEAFGLGYAPNRIDVLAKSLKKKGVSVQEMEKAGLVIKTERGVIDRFRGRVMFPIRNQRGQVVALGGRVLPQHDNGRTGKYINSPETAAYRKSESLYGLDVTKADIRKVGRAVVVEGELDLLSSWQVGVTNVVAIKGSVLTEEQARILTRFTSEVTLALDSDFAGDTAAVRGVSEIQKVELDIKVARMGETHKDPDDFAREDPEGYKKALKNAIGVWDFLIEVVLMRAGEANKSKASRELTPILASITDRIVQAHYTKVVADKLGVPFEAVQEQVDRSPSRGTKQKEEPGYQARKVHSSPVEAREGLEMRLLAIVFQEGVGLLVAEDWDEYLVTPLARKIVEQYQKYTKKVKKFEPKDFFEALPEELKQGFSELFMDDVAMGSDSAKDEVKKIKARLTEMDVKAKMDTLVQQMRKYEKSGESKKLALVQKEFGLLTRQRKGTQVG